jgi:UDP-4-keto-D-QuiNAc 4-reductase
MQPENRPVLVTGATGFVGDVLLRSLVRAGVPVRAALRAPSPAMAAAHPSVAPVVVGDLAADCRWDEALLGVDCVIHLAARVHVMNDAAADPLAAFRAANVEGTVRLAQAAARAGVRRLVFASSIKVNGESTLPGRPFGADSPPQPVDPYGISKLEAEQRLQRIAAATGLELVTLRPVLMYGPGVKGNLERLLRWVRRGVPLPFASVDNRRSLLSVDNFVDALQLAASHPRAAGGTFLVADGDDLSTPDLVRRMARAVGRRPRLVPVPPGLLQAAAAALGRGAEVSRLIGSLQVDASLLRDRLGWRPPVSVDEGLARMVRAAAEPHPQDTGPG